VFCLNNYWYFGSRVGNSTYVLFVVLVRRKIGGSMCFYTRNSMVGVFCFF